MTCKYPVCQITRPLNSTYELRLGWHIPCLNAKHAADRKVATSWTHKPAATRQRQREYSKRYYRENKEKA